MPDTLPESWQIFIDHYLQFTKTHRKLATMEWFQTEGWSAFIGYYHAGIYMQVYKHNWFNYSLDGVHFETGLGAENLTAKTLQLDLHVGHRNLFDREKFNEFTIPRMAEVTQDWDNVVRFSKTNLSDRLSLNIRFTKTGFAKQVATAFQQLSTLAPIIDEGIAHL